MYINRFDIPKSSVYLLHTCMQQANHPSDGVLLANTDERTHNFPRTYIPLVRWWRVNVNHTHTYTPLRKLYAHTHLSKHTHTRKPHAHHTSLTYASCCEQMLLTLWWYICIHVCERIVLYMGYQITKKEKRDMEYVWAMGRWISRIRSDKYSFEQNARSHTTHSNTHFRAKTPSLGWTLRTTTTTRLLHMPRQTIVPLNYATNDHQARSIYTIR